MKGVVLLKNLKIAASTLTIMVVLLLSVSLGYALADAESQQEALFDIGFTEIRITSDLDPFTTDRDFWHRGTMTVNSTVEEFSFENVDVRLRGRGNSTWWFGEEKRPLRFRFDEPREMLDSSHAHRDWILLANHFDRSLLRNHTALFLAGLLDGMDYVPSNRMIHLYVNDVYMGVYQLTDERDIDPGRVPLTLNSDPTISEFFLELDGRLTYSPEDEGLSWVMVGRIPFDIRFPGGDLRSQAHAEYVQAYLTQVDMLIRNRNFAELLNLIDIQSFIDFYLVQEFMKNPDVGFSSVFMTIRGQDDSRRLYMGPIWDFDLAAGNFRNQAYGEWIMYGEYGYSPYGLTAATRNRWFRHLMRMPQFVELATARWNEIRHDQIDLTIRHIEEFAARHATDFERNFKRHQIMGTRVWEEPDSIVAITNFSGQVEFLVNWIEARANWLDEFFENALDNIPAVFAFHTDSKVLLNGENISFESYLISGYNFFRLRDLAYVLNSTDSRFSVEWDGLNNIIFLTRGEEYIPVGGEMGLGAGTDQIAVPTKARVFLDSEEVIFPAYEINGNNFIMLRDLMSLLDVSVIWDEPLNSIIIDTSLPYNFFE
jgi:spore coat protein CotH